MIHVNQRGYALPKQPTVVVCVDGCEPDYTAQAVAHGRMPWLQRVLADGTTLIADCVIPSFTNPSNLSIVTGAPPSVHGMRGICFSAEKADEATLAENGIAGVPALVGMPVPSVYSAELSEFVFAAGVTLMRRDATTHKRPHVIYLQDLLDDWLGKSTARVILPITDPYVMHHGTLGSFATVYLPGAVDVGALLTRLTAQRGIESAWTRAQAAERFELPAGRIGDIVVVAERSTVIGTATARHDLSALDAPLRSPGGGAEQRVPLILNRAVAGLDPQRRWRNFDAFELALDHAQ